MLLGRAANSNLPDRSVVIKPGSTVVTWGKGEYLKEAEKQLSFENAYKKVRITEKDQVELVEKGNKLLT